MSAGHDRSETASLVREGAGWRLRRFTPTTEVALRGYATLAAALVLATERGDAPPRALGTRAGTLGVERGRPPRARRPGRSAVATAQAAGPGPPRAKLVPLRAARLGPCRLVCRQVPRRGTLVCELAGARVPMGGRVRRRARGEILLPG